MSITKLVKAVFAKPETKLAVLIPGLRELRNVLKGASVSTDKLRAIVVFFDSVSKWHDRGLTDLIEAFEEVNYGQYGGVIEDLRTLELHFRNAGRSACGWNRTKRGEAVTANKVFLGNIHGLFTKTVAYWMTTQDELGYKTLSGKNTYEVVSEQAREFMETHTGPMIDIIKRLEAFAAK